MRRRIVIALLALGTVAGYGSAIAHAAHHRHASCGSCDGWHHGEPPSASPQHTGEAPPPPP
jgi:hypothetical protein